MDNLSTPLVSPVTSDTAPAAANVSSMPMTGNDVVKEAAKIAIDQMGLNTEPEVQPDVPTTEDDATVPNLEEVTVTDQAPITIGMDDDKSLEESAEIAAASLSSVTPSTEVLQTPDPAQAEPTSDTMVTQTEADKSITLAYPDETSSAPKSNVQTGDNSITEGIMQMPPTEGSPEPVLAESQVTSVDPTLSVDPTVVPVAEIAAQEAPAPPASDISLAPQPAVPVASAETPVAA